MGHCDGYLKRRPLGRTDEDVLGVGAGVADDEAQVVGGCEVVLEVRSDVLDSEGVGGGLVECLSFALDPYAPDDLGVDPEEQVEDAVQEQDGVSARPIVW